MCQLRFSGIYSWLWWRLQSVYLRLYIMVSIQVWPVFLDWTPTSMLTSESFQHCYIKEFVQGNQTNELRDSNNAVFLYKPHAAYLKAFFFSRGKFLTMETVWPVAVLSASLTDWWFWAQTQLVWGQSQRGLSGLKASVAWVTWQVILKRTAVHDILFPVEDSNEFVSLLLLNSLSASECLRFMIPHCSG